MSREGATHEPLMSAAQATQAAAGCLRHASTALALRSLKA